MVPFFVCFGSIGVCYRVNQNKSGWICTSSGRCISNSKLKMFSAQAVEDVSPMFLGLLIDQNLANGLIRYSSGLISRMQSSPMSRLRNRDLHPGAFWGWIPRCVPRYSYLTIRTRSCVNGCFWFPQKKVGYIDI